MISQIPGTQKHTVTTGFKLLLCQLSYHIFNQHFIKMYNRVDPSFSILSVLLKIMDDLTLQGNTALVSLIIMLVRLLKLNATIKAKNTERLN